ncbi:glycerate kinase [Pseudomonas aeruginosa]|uniref:glycerate kinase n=1 Tax=Pseudomonas aeruginosa TaxID=287 RepID=UPI002032BDF1|nr:glycerate kinase [Pseudomonas aeruginosa]MCM2071176.1 glycerate kinase [Pseudomonas aeruginosa]
MKIVIAPDSFKESLSAPDVAEAIARGWRRVFPQAEVLLRPLADGGEGTVDAVLAATAGERRECRVEGPLGEPTLAHWGWLDDATAVIEMASASGLHLVPRDRRDATRSSSRGTGELIRAALDAGARKIILGLGGSATNDAGAAGGLGFAARAFLRARFRPGIELVAELAGLADALVGADLVLTGEGRLDAQSLHGKTPVGVARIARQAGVPVVALAGSLGDGYQRLHDAGIDAAFSLAPGPISLEQACAGAAAELEARAEQIARLWRLAQASREG